MAFLPPAAPCRRLLLGTSALTLLLPWLLGEFAKQFLQPGLSDDPVRQQLLVDYVVIGALVFGLTMVLTVAIGCWVRAVMQGPPRRADAYDLPSEDPNAPSQ